MSLSPARQHRLRVQAEQAAREGGSVRHASGYDLMLLQLAEDRRRLKGVQSTVKKAEIKVELLPKYAAWAEGVLATRKENVFISWVMRLLIVVSLAWTGWAITLVFYLLTVIAFWITRNQMAQQVAA